MSVPISLSRVFMPFPYRKNPFYEAAVGSMNEALVRHRLIRRHQLDYHVGFNLLNAFFFPRVSRDKLVALSRMIDFFFLCDDIYDTTSSNGKDVALVEDLLRRNVEIIQTGRLPPHPDALNVFAYETLQEFAALQTEVQRQRLARSISDYLLEGSLALMRLWARGEIPDVATYREIRQYDVAMYATIDVSELASDVVLPSEVFAHEHLARMRRAANLQVAMANDILSYPKEVLRDECPYNMVHVVAVERGVEFADAVLEVIDMVNTHTRDFLDLEARLPSWDEAIDASVRQYVRGMKDLMGGNWYWSFECTRYNSADSPFVELRTTELLLRNKSKGFLVTEYPKTRRRNGTAGATMPAAAAGTAAARLPGSNGGAPMRQTPPSKVPIHTGYPLFGILPELLRRPLDTTTALAAEHGGVVRLRLGLADAYLVTDPEYIAHILIDNYDNYWKGTVNHRARFLFGDSLISTDGDFWKKQRKMINPSFHRDQLARITDVMVARIAEVVERWRSPAAGSEVVDVGRDIEILTMDIVIRAVFRRGLSPHEVERMGATVAQALHLAQLRFFTFFLPEWFPLPGTRATRTALDTFNATVYRLIAERRQSGAEEADLLSMLMAARDESDAGMSDRQLRDEITLLLSAGGEAPALGLGWCWHLLAQHPEIEARLLAEVDAVLEGRRPTFADLPRLVYTKRVYEEALRLYPPVWMFFRQAYGSDRLGDFELPAGAKVLLSPYVTHRSPRYWDQPEVFDPDRFSPERSGERHRCAYFPFGSGRRLCLGSNFAMMEGPLILAMVTQAFRLRPAPGHQPIPLAASGLRSRNSIHMLLEPRSGVRPSPRSAAVATWAPVAATGGPLA